MIYKNPMATITGRDKLKLYKESCENGATVCKDTVVDGRPEIAHVPLASVPVSQVEFIGGMWRVQNDFPHEIIDVRGRKMVLGKKRDKVEFGAFTYYDGYLVGYNCFGPFILDRPNCVVGRVDTATGSVWAYGNDIPAVRAFLSVALFDRNRDVIFSAEGIKNNEKSR